MISGMEVEKGGEGEESGRGAGNGARGTSKPGRWLGAAEWWRGPERGGNCSRVIQCRYSHTEGPWGGARVTEEAMGTAPSRYFVWGPQPAAMQGMTGNRSRRYTIKSTDHVSCPGRWLLTVGLCSTQNPSLHHSLGGTWALRSLHPPERTDSPSPESLVPRLAGS